VPFTIRATIRGGKKEVAAARVEVNCHSVNFAVISQFNSDVPVNVTAGVPTETEPYQNWALLSVSGIPLPRFVERFCRDAEG
jgi:hypothetical protein